MCFFGGRLHLWTHLNTSSPGPWCEEISEPKTEIKNSLLWGNYLGKLFWRKVTPPLSPLWTGFDIETSKIGIFAPCQNRWISCLTLTWSPQSWFCHLHHGLDPQIWCHCLPGQCQFRQNPSIYNMIYYCVVPLHIYFVCGLCYLTNRKYIKVRK